MYNIIIGSLLISLLHAVIPNHWLPVLAIGKKEGWSLTETSRITFIAGMAHVLSTIIIGLLLGLIGKELTEHIEHFTHIIAPSVSEDAPVPCVDEFKTSGLAFPVPHEEGQEIAIEDNEQ